MLTELPDGGEADGEEQDGTSEVAVPACPTTPQPADAVTSSEPADAVTSSEPAAALTSSEPAAAVTSSDAAGVRSTGQLSINLLVLLCIPSMSVI